MINPQYNEYTFSFQYYEMSYGLNVEMHKQVCIILIRLLCAINSQIFI